MFHNKADLTFENVTDQWGLKTNNVSNGVAYVDLDNDGDLDIVVNNMGEKASVYRNNNISSGNYFAVQLKGLQGNTNAIGSRIDIITDTDQQQTAEMQPVRGYLSSMEPVVHFGLGKDSIITSLTVRWPQGGYSVLKNVKANQTLTIDANKIKIDSVITNPVSNFAFKDVSKETGIDFKERENEYVDFKQESLLPWQLSRQGPKMSKEDVNGDGLEDVFIGAPQNEKSCLYLQQKNANFKRSSSQPWQAENNCDNAQSVFFDVDGDKDMDLYIVSGGNENLDASSYQDRLYINDSKGNFTKAKDALPEMNSSKSCVAIADYNADGKLDIFVGGRVVPGSYGSSPQSYLLQNETVNGKIKFVDVVATVAPSLQRAGMITSAAWTDLNKDHLPDLIVAGEWMPVKIFINSRNKLDDKTEAYGLRNSNGLWTCIVPMDIDGDGDEDFLLGNLTPNTQFNATVQQPMTLCVNDYFKTGKPEPVLCYYIKDKAYPYASRNEILEDMPALRKKFLYYKDYAVAGLHEVFAPDQQKGMTELKAEVLKNCWLENAGDKMILRELPMAAQFSAIQGAAITSIHNDGTKQIFAAGNFYPFRVQLGREDAAKGVLLQWDNKKHAVVQSNLSLGIYADGDVRDVLSVKSAQGQFIIISKNNESVQVVKPTVQDSQKKNRF
jgi:hypothetical protein